MSDRVTSPAERLEAVAQILILLSVGGLAGAVSFVHVHDWTVHNGQLSWVGWTNAMVTELIQIAGGLEIRRRKREALPTRAVMGVLVAAVAVSLTAQVAQAAPTVFGWVVSALPALGFLTVVKIVMARAGSDRAVTAGPVTVTPDLDRPVTATATRSGPTVTVTAAVTGSDRARAVGPGPTVDLDPTGRGPDLDLDLVRSDLPVTVGASPGPVTSTPDRTSTGPGPVPLDLDRDRDRDPGLDLDLTRSHPDRSTGPAQVTPLDLDRDRLTTAGFDPDLIDRGLTALTTLTATGATVNRGTFAMHLRQAGQPIATNTAGHLLRALKEATA